MSPENNINLIKYFKFIYQYIYLFIFLLFLSAIIFFLMGNYKITYLLDVKFSLQSSQINKAINNLIHLENTFGTNFNNQVIPLQGNPDTTNYYNLILNNLQDLRKKDLNLKNFSEDDKIAIGFKVFTNSSKDIRFKFLSQDKILISKANENEFYLYIINLIKDKFHSKLEDNIEVIRNISELEFDRVKRKLNKKNEQLLRLTNLNKNDILNENYFILQNQIINLEDEFINIENRLILCEELYLISKKNIDEINYLREFSKSTKTLTNEMILNLLLYFLFTCIVFLFLVFILILIKENKKNE